MLSACEAKNCMLFASPAENFSCTSARLVSPKRSRMPVSHAGSRRERGLKRAREIELARLNALVDVEAFLQQHRGHERGWQDDDQQDGEQREQRSRRALAAMRSDRRRYIGEKRIARIAAQKIAPKYGQRIQPKASVTRRAAAETSCPVARGSSNGGELPRDSFDLKECRPVHDASIGDSPQAARGMGGP